MDEQVDRLTDGMKSRIDSISLLEKVKSKKKEKGKRKRKKEKGKCKVEKGEELRVKKGDEKNEERKVQNKLV